MRVAICDDVVAHRSQLRAMAASYFSQRSLSVEVDLFASAQALLSSFSPRKYQVLFLDIYMPGMTGMQAAQLIREQDDSCVLIFSTSSEEHALESYGVYAAGYLVKPYTQAQLDEILDWCAQRMPQLSETIDICHEWEWLTLPLADIIYIEVYGRKSIFHTTGRDYTVNRSLSALEQELTGDFLRCHRCYIVNMKHILSLTKTGFALTGGSTAPISLEMATRVKQSFFNWAYKNAWEGR